MNEQPRALQEDPVPAKWKTRWYRARECFLRVLSRFLRMPAPLEVNQALENWGWKNFQKGMEHYLGHCPFHPEEIALYAAGQGYFLCYSCSDEAYLRSLDNGPQTDPQHQHLQITDAMALVQRHPSLALRKLQHPTGGTTTQEFRAVHWPKAEKKD